MEGVLNQEKISEIYEVLMNSEIVLMEDPTEDGDYHALLYIQENLSKISVIVDRISRYQIMTSQSISILDRRCTTLKMSLRYTRSQKPTFKAVDTTGIQSSDFNNLANSTVALENELDDLQQQMRGLKLLDEAIDNKLQHLKRLNSDIRLQSKVVEDQIYLTSLGRGRKSGLQAKMENPQKEFPEKSDSSVEELDVSDL